ncbi:hypothetical protein ACKWTF_014355 [Chironomus riparius]
MIYCKTFDLVLIIVLLNQLSFAVESKNIKYDDDGNARDLKLQDDYFPNSFYMYEILQDIQRRPGYQDELNDEEVNSKPLRKTQGIIRAGTHRKSTNSVSDERTKYPGKVIASSMALNPSLKNISDENDTKLSKRGLFPKKPGKKLLKKVCKYVKTRKEPKPVAVKLQKNVEYNSWDGLRKKLAQPCLVYPDCDKKLG